MNRILKSNNGSTLIIILMVVMVLGLLIPVGYTWYNKMFLNENRLIHQKQAVNLSVSAMETFERQDNFTKIDYLTSHTYSPDHPLTVINDSELDLYQYAQDNDGNRLTDEQLRSLSGDYTVVVRGISGDKNHDQQKNANEPFFYEHKMTAIETVANGEVRIEKNEEGQITDTIWMSFRDFLDTYNQAGDVSNKYDSHPPGHCNENGNGHDAQGNGKGHEKDENCGDENEVNSKIVDGDVTVFSIGSSDNSGESLLRMYWEDSWGSWRNVYFTRDSISIEATGSITFTGPYAIAIIGFNDDFINLKSTSGDISIDYTSLISTIGSNSNISIEANDGHVKITNSILYAHDRINLTALSHDSFTFENIYFPFMSIGHVHTYPKVHLDLDFFYP